MPLMCVDDMVQACQQTGDAQSLIVLNPVHTTAAALKRRQRRCGLTNGLAGDGAISNAGATDFLLTLDQQNTGAASVASCAAFRPAGPLLMTITRRIRGSETRRRA
jgi:hypothetical protein